MYNINSKVSDLSALIDLFQLCQTTIVQHEFAIPKKREKKLHSHDNQLKCKSQRSRTVIRHK